jgi:DNA-binding CsgD family transcriptional regulator
MFETAGARGLRWLALPWWSYICVIAATFAILASGLPLPGILRPLHNWQDLAVRPFVAVNAVAACACAWLAARSLAGKGKKPGWSLAAAAALAILSQLGDALFLLDVSSQILSTPLIYLGYFGALGILAGEGRADRITGRETLAGCARGRDLGADWAREAKLDDEEAGLLALILAGKANKEIAPELGLGLSAEKHRVQKLFAKLGVATRKELLARAASDPEKAE